MDQVESSAQYQARHQAVETAVREAGLDAIVVVSDWRQKGNLRYLGDRVIWSRWCYIILKDGVEPTLIMIAPSQRFWAKREGSIRDVRFNHHPEQEVVEVLRALCPDGGTVGMAGMNASSGWTSSSGANSRGSSGPASTLACTRSRRLDFSRCSWRGP